jgi:hypothetical protein
MLEEVPFSLSLNENIINGSEIMMTTAAEAAAAAAAPFEEEQVIKISDIKIGNRLRKDVGDVSSLAASIARDGLYHPIGIDEDNNLIFGFRRIKAYEFLGRTEIPCTSVYIKNALQAEYDENVERKNFTITEIADIYKAVQDSRIGHRPKKGAVSAPFPKGKTREVTAKIAGHGKGEVKKIVELVDAAKANPDEKIERFDLKKDQTYGELLRNVDSGKTRLSKAYAIIKLDQARKKLREETRKAAEECVRSGKVIETVSEDGKVIGISFPELRPYEPEPEPLPSPELLRAHDIEQELMNDGELEKIIKIEYVNYNEQYHGGMYEVYHSELDMNSLEKLIRLCKELEINFTIKPADIIACGFVVAIGFWKEAEKEEQWQQKQKKIQEQQMMMIQQQQKEKEKEQTE